MRKLHSITPKQQMAAGFWVACGALVAIGIVACVYLAGSGAASQSTTYYPKVSKAPTSEAKAEFRAWSNHGLLHYHYERGCPELKKLDSGFVGKGVALGEPKRQAFDGMEMEPCPYCVRRK